MNGQILLESNFGQLLKRLAEEASEASDNAQIVEIGTWRGGGSTWCLRQGLKRGRLTSFEMNSQFFAEAQELYRGDEMVKLVYGSIIRPEEFAEYRHPMG